MSKPKTGPRHGPCLNYDVKISLKPSPRGVKTLGPIRARAKMQDSTRHVSKNLVLCSHHFTADSFTNKAQFNTGFKKKNKLKDDALPTILAVIRLSV